MLNINIIVCIEYVHSTYTSADILNTFIKDNQCVQWQGNQYTKQVIKSTKYPSSFYTLYMSYMFNTFVYTEYIQHKCSTYTSVYTLNMLSVYIDVYTGKVNSIRTEFSLPPLMVLAFFLWQIPLSYTSSQCKTILYAKQIVLEALKGFKYAAYWVLS